MRVHIDRAHGTGNPYGSTGSYQNNAYGSGSNIVRRDTNTPSSTFAPTNKILEARWIWSGSSEIDQYYREALEIEENCTKLKKIKEVYGHIPFSLIQRINAEPFKFTSEITSEPQIPPVKTTFQREYSISPSLESKKVEDSDVRGITESNNTTQKPKEPTYEEYKKIKPEATWDDYRKICRTPVTDWEPAHNGTRLVKRNAFGEEVDFLLLRRCGIYM